MLASKISICRLIIALFLLACVSNTALGDAIPLPETTVTIEKVSPNREVLNQQEAARVAELKKQQSVLDNLESTQQALQEKRLTIMELQREMKNAEPPAKAAMQIRLDGLNEEIKKLNQSFEQVAIGGVSLEVFGKEEEFNWQKELVLITKPLLEGLKGLTEKPRKVDRLRTIITERHLQTLKIENAINTVESRLSALPSTSVTTGLKETLATWQDYQKNNLREIELAEIQLQSLLGTNVPWYITIKDALKEFFSGRGKTLLIVLLVSLFIWILMKSLLWLLSYRKKVLAKTGTEIKGHPRKITSYRLALYLYKLLTVFLITISAMVVLYVQGDLLLLALMLIVFFGLAMGLRKILPSYIAEARILLNISAAREGERVIYHGIPWELAHINIHSILMNPCLQGVLRVPISELTNLNSRPISSEETWFPSSKGDYLLMPDGMVAQVIRQTPENVELDSRGGMRTNHPTQNFFSTDFYNLSAGGSFGVGSTFGIDYQHIDISLSVVPEVFKQAVTKGLRSAGFGEHIEDILVEFKTANSSSLDYLIYVTASSLIAASYFKIERTIQQSCVRACNEEKWNIPFPQLTVHKGES